jgi:hypothetical protein
VRGENLCEVDDIGLVRKECERRTQENRSTKFRKEE